MIRDAQNEANPEAESGPHRSFEDGESAVSKLAGDPAESGMSVRIITKFDPEANRSDGWLLRRMLLEKIPLLNSAHSPDKY